MAQFPANIDLSTLNGTTGFKLSGVAATTIAAVRWPRPATSTATASPTSSSVPGGPVSGLSGTSYVVFGQASGFAANIDLSSLDGTTGFKLSGAAAGDHSGFSVASAGDVNGDGFADLIVGAGSADPNGSASGASYVVFGKASGFAANVDLSTLDGATGFKLSGETAGDLQRPLGGLGRRRQRRRFRRPDRRCQASRPARQLRFRRELCGVRPGLGLCRQYRSLLARRHDRLQAQRRGGGRLQRRLGRLGRRRQRRRLRRPDRRCLQRQPERRRIRRELCGVRPGVGLRRQHRSVEPRRHHRLQAQRRDGGRPQRRLGGLGRRRQRRRLRRPDRRRPLCRPARLLLRRQLRGVRQGLGLCRQHRSLLARRHHRLQAQRRGGKSTAAAARSLRRATSTATALPT